MQITPIIVTIQKGAKTQIHDHEITLHSLSVIKIMPKIDAVLIPLLDELFAILIMFSLCNVTNNKIIKQVKLNLKLILKLRKYDYICGMAKQIIKQVPVYLPKATHAAFKKIAAKQGESMTKIILQMITSKIESEATNV